MTNTVFAVGSFVPDYVALHEFYDTKFIDVEGDAATYIYDPPQKWAIIKDCGSFPCTGPQNIILSFKDNKFEGIRPSYAATSF